MDTINIQKIQDSQKKLEPLFKMIDWATNPEANLDQFEGMIAIPITVEDFLS